MLQMLARIPVWDEILTALGWCLKGLYSWTGNYGVAIILLTVAVRIITLPLTIKQTSSMIALQKLQPQIKELQKKYKGDRETLGQEMMKLYKEHKVNPLGGCLPMIIQLPVIFALFEVLRRTWDYLKGAQNMGFLGISDLRATGSVLWRGGKVQIDIVKEAGKTIAETNPIQGGEYAAVIILILLTVITGYFSAKMMAVDPGQSKWTALLPLAMGFFAWILPAGVTLYIIVTNIFTIGQQFVQLRLISKREGEEEGEIEKKPKAGRGARESPKKPGEKRGPRKESKPTKGKRGPSKGGAEKKRGKAPGAKGKPGSKDRKRAGKGGKGGTRSK